MPASPGTYHVYVDVHAGGYLLLAYQSTEDIVIEETAEPPFSMAITNITIYDRPRIGDWSSAYWHVDLECQISNPYDHSISHTLKLGNIDADSDYQNLSAWYYKRKWGESENIEKVFTLSPGQSVTVLSKGFNSISGWYTWPQLNYHGYPVKNKTFFNIVDENWNSSPFVSAGTYTG
jgi:hypothetical protein